jgi:hypothetical protein
LECRKCQYFSVSSRIIFNYRILPLKIPLTDLLLFHIVPGVSLTSDLLPCEAGNNLLEMANGKDSRTLCTGKTSPIEQRGQFNDKADAPAFIDTDIVACNGVVSVSFFFEGKYFASRNERIEPMLSK